MKEFDKEKMHDLLIEHSEGNLTGELREYVERYIENNTDARKEFGELKKLNRVMNQSREFEPDATLHTEFDKMLQEEMKLAASKSAKRGKVISMPMIWTMRVAAGLAILILGYFLGTQFSTDKDELASLREEMEATRQLVMMALQNQSPSQRIMGVNYVEDMKQPDDQIMDVLIETLNEDENVNVRLAALNALTKLSSSEKVKLALIESLGEQTEPIVLISLIDALVNINEIRAVEKLQDLIDDDKNIQSVQDQAQYGLFKLM
ncbi:MAG TPA: HEAT repeat domain-containing protein [Cyclobacteriaceae bacterium]